MKWKRLLLFSFVASLSLSFLTPTIPAQAFELTTEVRPTGRSWYPSNVRCYYIDGTVLDRANDPACLVTNTKPLESMAILSPTADIKADHYYRFTLAYQWHSTQLARGLAWTPKITDDWVLVSFEQIVSQDTAGDGNGTAAPFNNMFEVTLQAKKDMPGGRFSMGNSGQNQALAVVFPSSNTGSTYVVFGQVFEYAEFDSATAVNNQQQEAGEQAQSDGNTASDSSQQQADSTGTTLLGAFQSFVGAISSASPTSCVINANIGDFKMGNADLCSLTVPPAVKTIGSILLIAFCVPLSLALVNKMIGLFRSFQNG